MEKQGNTDEGSVAALKMVEGITEGMTPQTLQRSAMVMLVYESLTLFGAYFMFHLRRRGFYLYMGGVFAGLLGAVVLVGGLPGIVLTMGSLFFSFIFLLLYRSQLNHLS